MVTLKSCKQFIYNQCLTFYFSYLVFNVHECCVQVWKLPWWTEHVRIRFYLAPDLILCNNPNANWKILRIFFLSRESGSWYLPGLAFKNIPSLEQLRANLENTTPFPCVWIFLMEIILHKKKLLLNWFPPRDLGGSANLQGGVKMT